MKVLLIDPSARRFMYTMHKGKIPRSHRYPGLGLTTVAALCPPDVEAQVRILDDEFEQIDFRDLPDLAGISLLTYSARRGYQIARQFRQRGVPVVLGGSHVTACPDEAKLEAEAIVTGEAEDTWPQLLRDFRRGAMKPVYRSTNQASLARSARGPARPAASAELYHRQHHPGHPRLPVQLRVLFHRRVVRPPDPLPSGRRSYCRNQNL